MEKEQELIENKELREKCITHYEVLEKVKDLLLLPDNETSTVKQIAEYYSTIRTEEEKKDGLKNIIISEDTIQKIYQRNKEEFGSDGVALKSVKDFLSGQAVQLKTLQGKSILTYDSGFELSIPNRGLKTFPKRAILRIGMLLTGSLVSEEIRTQLLNIEEKTSDEVKVADITEEQRLMIAVGMAMSSGDVNALGIASTNLVAFKNRHITQLEESNTKLTEDNKMLSNGILEWSDRKKLNAGVRKLASVCNVAFYEIWSELYKQLHYKYGINLKARNNGHKPFIENIKESEWEKVIKSFAAICEVYNQSPTDMLHQKGAIS